MLHYTHSGCWWQLRRSLRSINWPGENKRSSLITLRLRLDDRSHLTKPIEIDISMQGPVPVLYKHHFTALSPAQNHHHLHHFPQTHPARTQPCLFIIRRSHQVGRRGVLGGPLIIPRWPSTGVKTSLFYILSFCIRMARLLSSTKCTLNLSGGAIIFSFLSLIN